MASPQELSLSSIRDFMLKNGGKVTNHDLVKHFKKFLTNPTTQGKNNCLITSENIFINKCYVLIINSRKQVLHLCVK